MAPSRLNRLLLAFAGLVLVAKGALPVQQGSPPQLSASDVAVVAEAYHLWESLGESLWPGWTKIPMPLLFITEKYEYAVGFPDSITGFQKLSGVAISGRTIKVRERVLAPNLSASFDVQGHSAAVLGQPKALGKSPTAWVLTAAHEMFHVFQASRGSDGKIASLDIGPKEDASWQLNFPFPYKNDNAMNLIHLQSYPLYLSIQSSEEIDSKYNVRTALEAARVYENYLGVLQSDGKLYRYSQFQEWDEGVTFYAEYKLAQAAATGKYRPAEDFAALSGNKSYEQVWAEDYRQRLFLVKHAGRAARSRTAFYHLGFGKALALDRLYPEWKARYFDENIWLDDLLISALGDFK